MTPDELKTIMPNAKGRADIFAEPLNKACTKFGINTPARQAMFIAQVAQESGQLLYVRELASGAAYEGRVNLGNTSAGDGTKYKGRGLIQITGKANYLACEKGLGIPCVKNPALLETNENAAMSAAWFWATHGLNEIADAGDFIHATKRINGGTNGLANRQAFWKRAKQVFKVP